jgi:hypothetical protein
MSYLCYLCLFVYSGVQKILLCFSSSCVHYVASLSGLPFLIAPSVFSNVCLDSVPVYRQARSRLVNRTSRK